MHEVSIALGMIDEVTRIARENNAQKILAVNLKIGKMSGIVIDSLKFAFDAIKLENPLLSDTNISIEEVPLIYECNSCNKSFILDSPHFPSCPECRSYKLKLISGEEMNIKNVEIEV